jgi:hypothetical protein
MEIMEKGIIVIILAFLKVGLLSAAVIPPNPVTYAPPLFLKLQNVSGTQVDLEGGASFNQASSNLPIPTLLTNSDLRTRQIYQSGSGSNLNSNFTFSYKVTYAEKQVGELCTIKGSTENNSGTYTWKTLSIQGNCRLYSGDGKSESTPYVVYVGSKK